MKLPSRHVHRKYQSLVCAAVAVLMLWPHGAAVGQEPQPVEPAVPSGFGVYYLDDADSRLLFSDGGEPVVVTTARGLNIVGLGKGGLIVQTRDPARVFSVRHGTREITEITATFVTNGVFHEIDQRCVVPTGAGHLVIVTFDNALFWTDGSQENLKRLQDDGLEFRCVFRRDGRVFARGYDRAAKRFAVYEVDAAGVLKKYGEQTIDEWTFSNLDESLADANYAGATRLFKDLGAKPHSSPPLDKLFGQTGKALMWNWIPAAPNVEWSALHGVAEGEVVGDTLYFTGVSFREQNGKKIYDDASVELYRTDGTTEGTRLAHDFDPRKTLTEGLSSDPRHLTPVGDRGLVLVANDLEDLVEGQVDPLAPSKPSIWGFDGITATRIARGAMPRHFQHIPEIYHQLGHEHLRGYFLAWGGHAYFIQGTNDTAELWKTNGTTKGTSRLLKTPGHVSKVFPTPSHVFFSVVDTRGHTTQLWACDGTAEGTRPVGRVQLPHTVEFFPIVAD